MPRQVTLIAAMGSNRAIGLAGRMPWHLPADLQHFKRETMGKSILMGRKTWQSIGRPLPGRQNIVISRDPGFTADGAVVCDSLGAAIEAAESEEVMVIGGGELYRLAMPMAQRMILTRIDIAPEADTWFPDWDERQWQKRSEQSFPAAGRDGPAYRFEEWRRAG